jgi:hypothetical protein
MYDRLAVYFPDELMSMVAKRDDNNAINTIVCT